MKKSIFVFLLAISISLVACGKKEPEVELSLKDMAPTQASVSEDEIAALIHNINNKEVSVDVCYGEGATSFDELLEKSEFILFGTVEETWKKSFINHSSRVKVTKNVKGETASEITIWQIEGDNNLQVGDKVLLFLGSQYKEEEKRIENQIYYPFGGGALGVYKYVNDPSEVQPQFGWLSKEDLVAWIKGVTE